MFPETQEAWELICTFADGGIRLESEERRGENHGPATHFSRNWGANPVVWRFAPRYTLAYQWWAYGADPPLSCEEVETVLHVAVSLRLSFDLVSHNL